MSQVFKSHWGKAYAWSLGLHVGVVAAIALVALYHGGMQAGSGRLSVELGGQYGGEKGGLGVLLQDGNVGNLGENGDGRIRTSTTPNPNAQSTHNLSEAARSEGTLTETQLTPLQKVEIERLEEKRKKKREQPSIDRGVDGGDLDIPVKSEKTPVKKVKKEKPIEKQQEQETKELVKEKTPVRKSDTNGKTGQNHMNAAAGGTGALGAAGTVTGTKDAAGSGVGHSKGEGAGEGSFRDNGDGTYTATGSGGLSFKIIHDAQVRYPRAARSIGYGRSIKVTVKFLVGPDGNVQQVQVLNKKLPDLGFKEEALRAVRQMQFEPIVYQGKTISVYFVKNIVFVP